MRKSFLFFAGIAVSAGGVWLFIKYSQPLFLAVFLAGVLLLRYALLPPNKS